MDKKTYIIIAIGVLTVLGTIIINKIKNDNTTNESTKTNIKLVENYSDFFTANGCATKYINYLTSENKDALIKVLNESYIDKNKITSENVLTKLDNFAGRSLTFSASKMYEEKISKKVNKYYLKGVLYEDSIDGSTKVGDYYLIVTIDNIQKLFDITPYDGKIFKEEQWKNLIQTKYQ